MHGLSIYHFTFFVILNLTQVRTQKLFESTNVHVYNLTYCNINDERFRTEAMKNYISKNFCDKHLREMLEIEKKQTGVRKYVVKALWPFYLEKSKGLYIKIYKDALNVKNKLDNIREFKDAINTQMTTDMTGLAIFMEGDERLYKYELDILFSEDFYVLQLIKALRCILEDFEKKETFRLRLVNFIAYKNQNDKAKTHLEANYNGIDLRRSHFKLVNYMDGISQINNLPDYLEEIFDDIIGCSRNRYLIVVNLFIYVPWICVVENNTAKYSLDVAEMRYKSKLNASNLIKRLKTIKNFSGRIIIDVVSDIDNSEEFFSSLEQNYGQKITKKGRRLCIEYSDSQKCKAFEFLRKLTNEKIIVNQRLHEEFSKIAKRYQLEVETAHDASK